MRHIVLDTNCLLQILGAHSPFHFLWEKFLDEEFVLCFSTEILLEYEEILTQKSSEVVANMFLKVINHSENTLRKDPYYRLELIKADKDDNKFVDCAFACQAEFIVTNDSHFDVLSTIPFPNIVVKSLEQFAQEFA